MSFEEPFTKDFVSKSEQRVCICIDDFGELIRVKDAEQTEVGRFEMQLADDSYYYLRWMHLDITDPSYVHQGIGRAALQFHKEICLVSKIRYYTVVQASHQVCDIRPLAGILLI